MIDPSITYFPVGNGDTSLILLSNGLKILIDCNITEKSKEESDETYDVHNHLLAELDGDNENPSIDAFILTHPDEDHCRGFEEIFYTGNPANYSKSDKEAGLIIIDELWFTPRIFSPHEKDLSKQAGIIHSEAKRRMQIYKEKKSKDVGCGNRLRVIGYSDNPALDGLDDNVITAPGSSLNFINGQSLKDFSFFVHAPFRNDTDSKWSERNDTSVVLQARFDVDEEKDACLAFFGGDSGYTVWENIIQRTKEEQNLRWDLFMAPHHCSWSFFNETPYEDHNDPSESSLDFLNYLRSGAIIVASCNPIKDDDNNPPHYAAKEQYLKSVGKEKFYVTGEYPPNSKKPSPITFRVTRNGPQEMNLSKSHSESSTAAINHVVKVPHTYGR